DLLEGLDEVGEGFDQWLAMERTRIEDQFAAQATEAALRIGGRGGHAALQRLAERLPFSDVVGRATIQLHLAEGDAAGARSALTAYRGRLMRGLGEEPPAEISDLLEGGSQTRRPAEPRSSDSPRRPDLQVETKAAFVPRVVLLPPLQEHKNGLPR